MKRTELRRKLRKMGIPVKAGMVKKSDIKKVLAEKNVLDSVAEYLDSDGYLKEDYVAMLNGEYVERIDEDNITTLQGIEHFGTYPTEKHISELIFFKAI